jgi:hypothetical protein
MVAIQPPPELAVLHKALLQRRMALASSVPGAKGRWVSWTFLAPLLPGVRPASISARLCLVLSTMSSIIFWMAITSAL